MEPVTAVAAASLLSIYLERVASRAGEVTTEALGEVAKEAFRRLYAAVKVRLSRDRFAAQALSRLEDQPTNDRRKTTLIDVLTDISAEDPAFAAELRSLVSEVQTAAAPHVSIQESGAVSVGGSLSIEGQYAAGRDITFGREPE